MRLLAAGVALVVLMGVVSSRSATMDFHPLAESSGDPLEGKGPGDTQALQEMFGSSQGPQRWRRAPELTILVSVMEYRPGGDVQYLATSERLDEAEITEMIRDLTGGLAVLTADTFRQFSSVRYEIVPAGTTATVSRPDQIVTGRFNGLRRAVNTLGLGGRRARKDGTITAGAILLDRDFDATRTSRRLLRTHELGHALGYNHVHARASIMNPRIGTEPNEFDREAALIAFRTPAVIAAR